jgi:mannitol/fructose-specific phosphotransferase system IIA component (Ntr-type)
MAGILAPLLASARLSLKLQSSGREAALSEIARLLDGHPDVTDFPGFYRELLARERIDSTSLGNEIALPHARTEHVARIVMAIGRSDSGVYYENCDETVHLIFALGTPESSAGDYLQVVGILCRIIKDSANREALLQAPTPADFIQTLLNLESRVLTSGSSPRPRADAADNTKFPS